MQSAGKDRQRQAGHVGHQSVGFIILRTQETRAGVLGGDDFHIISVHLFGQYTAFRFYAERGAEPAVIFQNIFFAVTPVQPQVQRGEYAAADATQPGGKPVGKAARRRGGRQSGTTARFPEHGW